MPSQIQLEANRANAQLSTGPRTEEGKARAALNSRKHGLSAAHLFIPDADREAFESMQANFLEDLSPQGELELTLFDTLLHANWNIRRCRIVEAGLLRDPEQDEAKLRQLDRYTRRHESNFNRGKKELRALQTAREFRRLAAMIGPPTEQPSSLVNTQAVRWAHLRERAATNRIDSIQLGRALDRVRPFSPPPPGKLEAPTE